MKKKTPANTSGSENSGWESSEKLDATSVLHPADVHAAVADNAPTTVFSSDETQVLSDYQDATQVLNAHETVAPADSEDSTEVIGATRPLPRAYRAPIQIPETIPSAQERASQGNYSADEPLQATRRLDPPRPPVSGYPLNANMGAGHRFPSVCRRRRLSNRLLILRRRILPRLIRTVRMFRPVRFPWMLRAAQ